MKGVPAPRMRLVPKLRCVSTHQHCASDHGCVLVICIAVWLWIGDAGARSYFTLGFDIAIDTNLKVWVMEVRLFWTVLEFERHWLTSPATTCHKVNQRPDDNSSVGPFGMFPDSPYLQGMLSSKTHDWATRIGVTARYLLVEQAAPCRSFPSPH